MIYRLNDPAFLDDPGPQLARMRSDGPLVRAKIPLLGSMWVTTTDEAARKLLKSPDLFRRDPGPITGKSLARRFWWMPKVIMPLMHTMIVTDDPAHARQRRLVEMAFARTPIDGLRPRIEAIAQRLLDALPQTGPVDIVATYTRRLPFLAICELLGIPEKAHSALIRRIAPLSAVSNPVSAVYAMARLGGVQREFRAMFAQARKSPKGPGLISALAQMDDKGVMLTEEELLSLTLLLFLAGHETTVHLINAAITTLARDPALRQQFIERPEARSLFVEEIMRSTTPVMLTKPMFAAQDTDILGARVRRGEMVAALLLAANHDPARVEAPDELRPERRPNAHLGFGFGPHVCLGMQLARVEAVTALCELLTRHPDFKLAKPPGWLSRTGFRAPARVMLDLQG